MHTGIYSSSFISSMTLNASIRPSFLRLFSYYTKETFFGNLSKTDASLAISHKGLFMKGLFALLLRPVVVLSYFWIGGCNKGTPPLCMVREHTRCSWTYIIYDSLFVPNYTRKEGLARRKLDELWTSDSKTIKIISYFILHHVSFPYKIVVQWSSFRHHCKH